MRDSGRRLTFPTSNRGGGGKGGAQPPPQAEHFLVWNKYRTYLGVDHIPDIFGVDHRPDIFGVDHMPDIIYLGGYIYDDDDKALILKNVKTLIWRF